MKMEKLLINRGEKLFAGEWKKGDIPELWDGRAADRIIEKILGLYGN